MHHAGSQYGQQQSAMSTNQVNHMQQQQQQQQHYAATAALQTSTGPNVELSSGSTSALRQWRKKEDKPHSDVSASPAEPQVGGPVARVAPHAHYPRTQEVPGYHQTNRYHSAYSGDFASTGLQPYKEHQVKYSEIVEPQHQPQHLVPIVGPPKPLHKDKDYMEMCTVLHQTTSPQVQQQVQQQVVQQPQMKHYTTSTANPNTMLSYKESHLGLNMNQPSTYHPHSHPHLQKDPYPYAAGVGVGQNYKLGYNRAAMVAAAAAAGHHHQYQNEYLSFAPPPPSASGDMQQMYQYHHNRPSLQTQRNYHRNYHPGGGSMVPPTGPGPGATGYGSHPAVQQYFPSAAKNSSDLYRANPYTAYKLQGFDLRNISPRRVYQEGPMGQFGAARISPQYCNTAQQNQQLEYAQHYQNRRGSEQYATQIMNQVPYASQIVADDVSMSLGHHPSVGLQQTGLDQKALSQSHTDGKSSLQQFFENWNGNDEFGEERGRERAPQQAGATEDLYILDSTEIPQENVGELIHLQVEKLPENIKGFLSTSVITSPLNLTQDSVIREPGSVISQTKKVVDSETPVASASNSVIVFGEHNKAEGQAVAVLDENRNNISTDNSVDNSVIKINTGSRPSSRVNSPHGNRQTVEQVPKKASQSDSSLMEQSEEFPSPRTPGSTLEEIPKPLNAIEEFLDNPDSDIFLGKEEKDKEEVKSSPEQLKPDMITVEADTVTLNIAGELIKISINISDLSQKKTIVVKPLSDCLIQTCLQDPTTIDEEPLKPSENEAKTEETASENIPQEIERPIAAPEEPAITDEMTSELMQEFSSISEIRADAEPPEDIIEPSIKSPSVEHSSSPIRDPLMDIPTEPEDVAPVDEMPKLVNQTVSAPAASHDEGNVEMPELYSSHSLDAVEVMLNAETCNEIIIGGEDPEQLALSALNSPMASLPFEELAMSTEHCEEVAQFIEAETTEEEEETQTTKSKREESPGDQCRVSIVIKDGDPIPADLKIKKVVVQLKQSDRMEVLKHIGRQRRKYLSYLRPSPPKKREAKVQSCEEPPKRKSVSDAEERNKEEALKRRRDRSKSSSLDLDCDLLAKKSKSDPEPRVYRNKGKSKVLDRINRSKAESSTLEQGPKRKECLTVSFDESTCSSTNSTQSTASTVRSGTPQKQIDDKDAMMLKSRRERRDSKHEKVPEDSIKTRREFIRSKSTTTDADKRVHVEKKDDVLQENHSSSSSFISEKHNFSILTREHTVKTKTKIKTPSARNKKLESLMESTIHQVGQKPKEPEETKEGSKVEAVSEEKGLEEQPEGTGLMVKTKAQLKEPIVSIGEDPIAEITPIIETDIAPAELVESSEPKEQAADNKKKPDIPENVPIPEKQETPSKPIVRSTVSTLTATQSLSAMKQPKPVRDTIRKRLSLAEYKKKRCDTLPVLDEERKGALSKSTFRLSLSSGIGDDFETLLERRLDVEHSKLNIPAIIDTIPLNAITLKEMPMPASPSPVMGLCDRMLRPADPRLQHCSSAAQKNKSERDNTDPRKVQERRSSYPNVPTDPRLSRPQLKKRPSLDQSQQLPGSSNVQRGPVTGGQAREKEKEKEKEKAAEISGRPRVEQVERSYTPEPKIQPTKEMKPKMVEPPKKLAPSPQSSVASSTSGSEDSASSSSASESDSSDSEGSSGSSGRAPSRKPKDDAVTMDLNKEIDDIFSLTQKKFEIRPRNNADGAGAKKFLINLDEIKTNLNLESTSSEKESSSYEEERLQQAKKRKKLFIDPDDFNLDDIGMSSNSESDREAAAHKQLIDLNELLPDIQQSSLDKVEGMEMELDRAKDVSDMAHYRRASLSGIDETDIDNFINKEPPSLYDPDMEVSMSCDTIPMKVDKELDLLSVERDSEEPKEEPEPVVPTSKIVEVDKQPDLPPVKLGNASNHPGLSEVDETETSEKVNHTVIMCDTTSETLSEGLSPDTAEPVEKQGCAEIMSENQTPIEEESNPVVVDEINVVEVEENESEENKLQPQAEKSDDVLGIVAEALDNRSEEAQPEENVELVVDAPESDENKVDAEQPIPNNIQEPIEEPVEEPIEEPTEEPISEPVKEPTPEPEIHEVCTAETPNTETPEEKEVINEVECTEESVSQTAVNSEPGTPKAKEEEEVEAPKEPVIVETKNYVPQEQEKVEAISEDTPTFATIIPEMKSVIVSSKKMEPCPKTLQPCTNVDIERDLDLSDDDDEETEPVLENGEVERPKSPTTKPSVILQNTMTKNTVYEDLYHSEDDDNNDGRNLMDLSKATATDMTKATLSMDETKQQVPPKCHYEDYLDDNANVPVNLSMNLSNEKHNSFLISNMIQLNNNNNNNNSEEEAKPGECSKKYKSNCVPVITAQDPVKPRTNGTTASGDNPEDDVSCTIEETKVIIRNLGKSTRQSNMAGISNHNNYTTGTVESQSQPQPQPQSAATSSLLSNFNLLYNFNSLNHHLPPGASSAGTWQWQQYYQEYYQHMLYLQQQHHQFIEQQQLQLHRKAATGKPSGSNSASSDKQYASVLSNEDLKMKLQVIPSSTPASMSEVIEIDDNDDGRPRRKRKRVSSRGSNLILPAAIPSSTGALPISGNAEEDYLVVKAREQRTHAGRSIPKLIIKRSISANNGACEEPKDATTVKEGDEVCLGRRKRRSS